MSNLPQSTSCPTSSSHSLLGAHHQSHLHGEGLFFSYSSSSSSSTVNARQSYSPTILPSSIPTYTERLSTLCSQSNSPFYNLFTLQHAIIELENVFFGLYQYRPEATSSWEYEKFELFYNLMKSDLQGKYRLLESMRTLDIYNPENTNPPYNPSCIYHIYNGRLKPITYTHIHSVPHTQYIYKSSKRGGQRDEMLACEQVLGDGYIRKKNKLEFKKGKTTT